MGTIEISEETYLRLKVLHKKHLADLLRCSFECNKALKEIARLRAENANIREENELFRRVDAGDKKDLILANEKIDELQEQVKKLKAEYETQRSMVLMANEKNDELQAVINSLEEIHAICVEDRNKLTKQIKKLKELKP